MNVLPLPKNLASNRSALAPPCDGVYITTSGRVVSITALQDSSTFWGIYQQNADSTPPRWNRDGTAQDSATASKFGNICAVYLSAGMRYECDNRVWIVTRTHVWDPPIGGVPSPVTPWMASANVRSTDGDVAVLVDTGAMVGSGRIVSMQRDYSVEVHDMGTPVRGVKCGTAGYVLYDDGAYLHVLTHCTASYGNIIADHGRYEVRRVLRELVQVVPYDDIDVGNDVLVWSSGDFWRKVGRHPGSRNLPGCLEGLPYFKNLIGDGSDKPAGWEGAGHNHLWWWSAAIHLRPSTLCREGEAITPETPTDSDTTRTTPRCPICDETVTLSGVRCDCCRTETTGVSNDYTDNYDLDSSAEPTNLGPFEPVVYPDIPLGTPVLLTTHVGDKGPNSVAITDSSVFDDGTVMVDVGDAMYRVAAETLVVLDKVSTASTDLPTVMPPCVPAIPEDTGTPCHVLSPAVYLALDVWKLRNPDVVDATEIAVAIREIMDILIGD